ncbi:MAG: hypothetical protein AAF617_02535 [Bacteroidota bacterium]
MKTNYFTYYHPFAIFFLIGLYLGGLIYVQQFHWTYPFLGLGITILLLETIDKWLWKYPPFSWLFLIKDFSGTYKGNQECFIIEKVDGECEINMIYIIAEMEIVQTGSSITVNAIYRRKKKKTSSSFSNLCMLTKTKDKKHFQLVYHYTNEGSGAEGLDKHSGTCFLTVRKKKGQYFLDGNYYTNRQPYPTRGNFQSLEKIKNKN